MTAFLNRIGPKIKIANTLIEKELNKQFAEIFRDNDQRQIVLRLSDKGFNLIDKNIFKIRTIMTNINKRITKGLSKQEISELEQVLNRISDNF